MKIALVIAALTFCAPVHAAYWVKVYPPMQLTGVYVVDDIKNFCPRSTACTHIKNAMSATVYIKAGQTKEDFDCDMKHELAHVDGWMHDDRPVFRKDCGEVPRGNK